MIPGALHRVCRKWDPVGVYTGDLMTGAEYDECAMRNGRHVHRYAVEIRSWRAGSGEAMPGGSRWDNVVIDGSLRGNQLREINHCKVPGEPT